ncbi:hypothetical protein SODALDRAFT_363090 [Sodiomyces alkalinus F11]|uniref:Uncharacterized protein n=1 Tax=Sodiomyces alkalinus (strain CBS 110278 / VKM F-3762 / F11) TaxID=1314773 RepID=A0A3N2PL73_SODAK|nr:hypothetical protein SODALDRAFT_363090 [Sodiomyces alkalinus F11]ROT35278.1 hypothetical protein SODALDRAFT_363090 [Sodiomyces alkalinus F11]
MIIKSVGRSEVQGHNTSADPLSCTYTDLRARVVLDEFREASVVSSLIRVKEYRGQTEESVVISFLTNGSEKQNNQRQQQELRPLIPFISKLHSAPLKCNMIRDIQYRDRGLAAPRLFTRPMPVGLLACGSHLLLTYVHTEFIRYVHNHDDGPPFRPSETTKRREHRNRTGPDRINHIIYSIAGPAKLRTTRDMQGPTNPNPDQRANLRGRRAINPMRGHINTYIYLPTVCLGRSRWVVGVELGVHLQSSAGSSWFLGSGQSSMSPIMRILLDRSRTSFRTILLVLGEQAAPKWRPQTQPKKCILWYRDDSSTPQAASKALARRIVAFGSFSELDKLRRNGRPLDTLKTDCYVYIYTTYNGTYYDRFAIYASLCGGHGGGKAVVRMWKVETRAKEMHYTRSTPCFPAAAPIHLSFRKTGPDITRRDEAALGDGLRLAHSRHRVLEKYQDGKDIESSRNVGQPKLAHWSAMQKVIGQFYCRCEQNKIDSESIHGPVQNARDD